MKTQSATVLCDHCCQTTVIIEFTLHKSCLDEINEKLRALGWQPEGDVCPVCVKRLAVDSGDRPA